jgi:hypothetical protein
MEEVGEEARGGSVLQRYGRFRGRAEDDYDFSLAMTCGMLLGLTSTQGQCQFRQVN